MSDLDLHFTPSSGLIFYANRAIFGALDRPHADAETHFFVSF